MLERELVQVYPHRSPRCTVVMRRALLLGGLACGAAGCADVKRAWSHVRRTDDPVVLPVVLSQELPFHYPPALYILRIQGDVTLHLHIDSLGMVVPESTTVAEHAPYAAFDSAALEGAPRLVFRPARRGERRVAYTVLFPIKFRVPGAPPLPGDTTR